ncbi:hypothetical protein TWF481_009122 [Arthrobotrys musiformis]|uniref:Uncharacterized protein n=1 Tax=Arthrobotrys musiformis TaxID=47236 RepID=A0AAV9W2W1_9PEZI
MNSIHKPQTFCQTHMFSRTPRPSDITSVGPQLRTPTPTSPTTSENNCIPDSGLLSPISITELPSPQPAHAQRTEGSPRASQTPQQLAKRQTGYLRAVQELDNAPITRSQKRFNRNRHTKPKFQPPIAAKFQKRKLKSRNSKRSERNQYILDQ